MSDRILNELLGYENQFKKYDKGEIDSKGSPYDYGSIMHYGSKAFSKNGKDTITLVDPTLKAQLGQRAALSEEDNKQISTLYSCSSG